MPVPAGVLVALAFALIGETTVAAINCGQSVWECLDDTCSNLKTDCNYECPKCRSGNDPPVLKDSSLALSVVYKNHTTIGEGELVVEWSYQGNMSHSDATTFGRLSLDIEVDSVKTCYCLPDNGPRFVFPLSDLTSHSSENLSIETDLYIVGTDQSLTASLTLDKHTHCWEEMGARSLEVCGVQIPSAPLNLSARLEVDCSSNTTLLSVDWSPPALHNTPILAYRVTARNADTGTGITSNTSYQTIIQPVNPAKAMIIEVQVRAGLAYPKGDCSRCLKERYKGKELAFGVRSTVRAVTVRAASCTPPSPARVEPFSEPDDLQVILPVAFSSALILVLVISAVVVLLICKWNSSRVVYYNYQDVPKSRNLSLQPSPVNPGPVFLVSSPEESEETQERLRHLVHDLADHGIEAVYYPYERAAQGADSPGALGIARWVERQFQRCNLVLFACTRTFSTEWSRENGDVMIPVVWCSRHVLDGILPHQDNISRFGVVLMGDNCDIPPSLRRFQVFPVFQRGGSSEAVHTERLVEYICQTPKFRLPAVTRILQLGPSNLSWLKWPSGLC